MKLLHNCLFVTEKALTVVVLLAFACAVFLFVVFRGVFVADCSGSRPRRELLFANRLLNFA